MTYKDFAFLRGLIYDNCSDKEIKKAIALIDKAEELIIGD